MWLVVPTTKQGTQKEEPVWGPVRGSRFGSVEPWRETRSSGKTLEKDPRGGGRGRPPRRLRELTRRRGCARRSKTTPASGRGLRGVSSCGWRIRQALAGLLPPPWGLCVSSGTPSYLCGSPQASGSSCLPPPKGHHSSACPPAGVRASDETLEKGFYQLPSG